MTRPFQFSFVLWMFLLFGVAMAVVAAILGYRGKWGSALLYLVTCVVNICFVLLRRRTG
jgi:hypothetical protein